MPEAHAAERASASPNPPIKRLRRYLVAGLLVWLPLLVTFFVVKFLVDLMDRSLLLIPTAYRPDTLLGFHIPGLGIGLTVLLLAGTGVLAANLVGRRLVTAWEGLLARIPLIRSLYSGVKHVTEQVLTSGGRSFKRVVMIEFPRRGMWHIAFQTSDHLGEVHPSLPSDLMSVFLPTTPNPTTGFVFFVPRADVVQLDIRVEDALKLIISLGVAVPDWRQHTRAEALASPRDPP